MRAVLALLAFVAGASAQNVPAIEASGNSLVFNVPRVCNVHPLRSDYRLLAISTPLFHRLFQKTRVLDIKQPTPLLPLPLFGVPW